MIECPQCGLHLPEKEPDQPQPVYCPNCGLKLIQPTQWQETGWGFIQRYFLDVWRILTQPSLFFRSLPLQDGLSGPLCFALVTHWVGSALGFLWRSLMGGAIQHWFQNLFRMSGEVIEVDLPSRSGHWNLVRERLLDWFFGVGPVIADPFITLISILFTSFLVFLGARLLITPGKEDHPKEISYESAVRLICFGMTPSILNAIPWFGGFLSSIGILIVTVIGAREIYRVRTGKALLIALFPKLLFLGIILIGVLAFTVVFIKLVASFLS
jgi:hypothetical protein